MKPCVDLAGVEGQGYSQHRHIGSNMKVTFEDIQKARLHLQNIVAPTAMSHSISASKLLGADIYFKFENTQRTGSFKFRGAYNKISNLTAAEKARGVVASSAG
ncbi:MAG: pyridoxal-phosphate dependent enzyme, partial [Bdellovibrio sp.]